jgi:cytochrome c-type biogenesis protein CcmE
LRKEDCQDVHNKLYLIIGLTSIILLAVTLTLAFTSFSDKLNFVSAPLEIVNQGNRQIIRVPVGGNLQ